MAFTQYKTSPLASPALDRGDEACSTASAARHRDGPGPGPRSPSRSSRLAGVHQRSSAHNARRVLFGVHERLSQSRRISWTQGGRLHGGDSQSDGKGVRVIHSIRQALFEVLRLTDATEWKLLLPYASRGSGSCMLLCTVILQQSLLSLVQGREIKLRRESAGGNVTPQGELLQTALQQLLDVEDQIKSLMCRWDDRNLPPFRSLPGTGGGAMIEVEEKARENPQSKVDQTDRRSRQKQEPSSKCVRELVAMAKSEVCGILSILFLLSSNSDAQALCADTKTQIHMRVINVLCGAIEKPRVRATRGSQQVDGPKVIPLGRASGNHGGGDGGHRGDGVFKIPDRTLGKPVGVANSKVNGGRDVTPFNLAGRQRDSDTVNNNALGRLAATGVGAGLGQHGYDLATKAMGLLRSAFNPLQLERYR